MSSTSEPRRRAGGRKPGGPNGEKRDQFVGFKIAKTERTWLLEILRKIGHKPTPEGMRDFLLEAAEDRQRAA